MSIECYISQRTRSNNHFFHAIVRADRIMPYQQSERTLIHIGRPRTHCEVIALCRDGRERGNGLPNFEHDAFRTITSSLVFPRDRHRGAGVSENKRANVTRTYIILCPIFPETSTIVSRQQIERAISKRATSRCKITMQLVRQMVKNHDA